MGYLLLAVGLLIIALPLFYAYNIFTGMSLPYEIFKNEKPDASGQNANPQDVQKQAENAVAKILPVALIYKTLNLISIAVLLSVFIFGGAQISKIGVWLIKSRQA